jgi:phosphoglycolate phosphatase-like HAD superfamily hydrolase
LEEPQWHRPIRCLPGRRCDQKVHYRFRRTCHDASSSDFVPPAQRIAVFDNDGTLWCEHPIYFQASFAFDRIRALASTHPEWKDKQPFKGVIGNDIKAALAAGKKALLEALTVAHRMTTEEFRKIVSDWTENARHPRFGRRNIEVVYQPMIELLHYLRGRGFKTFIVSGGGVEFMRVFAERVYGVPPEQSVRPAP